jgi:hypothetical protein
LPVNVVEFHIREYLDAPIAKIDSWSALTKRQVIVRVVVIVQSQTNLFQIVAALHPVGCFPDLLHSREQESDQDRNNRDDDKELDQGETPSAKGNG